MLRSIRYGLYGALLAGLVAVPVIWQSVDKTVDLTVDGRAVAVQTTAGTVGQLLSDRGYRLTSHDLVAPSRSTSIDNGSRVVLRHGHLLHLTVDGSEQNVWTTEPTVAAAVSALGYSTADFVSVSRSSRLPLSPSSLAIRTPQTVAVIHDGERQVVQTTETTVSGLLRELGLSVGPMDRLSTLASAVIVSGETIQLQRVVQRTLSKNVSVQFGTSKRKDSALAAGVTKVVKPGRKGTSRVTYALVYIDGKMAGRTRIGAATVTAPQAQVVDVGTKTSVKPPNTPAAGTPDPGSAMAIAKTLLADRGWGTDQYDCLVQMWDRESSWRVDAANPSGAYGIPQALPGSKMASAGPNWQTSAKTQITWGLGYIADRYQTPCGAWNFWQAHSYY